MTGTDLGCFSRLTLQSFSIYHQEDPWDGGDEERIRLGGERQLSSPFIRRASLPGLPHISRSHFVTGMTRETGGLPSFFLGSQSHGSLQGTSGLSAIVTHRPQTRSCSCCSSYINLLHFPKLEPTMSRCYAHSIRGSLPQLIAQN